MKTQLIPITTQRIQYQQHQYFDYMSLIYYSVDDLLKAGINKACHLVIVNRESSAISEEVLTDSETIVDVQTVSK